MKLKNLKKKIRRLEVRIQEDPKKLAKLKRKLNAIAAAKARKIQRKVAARAVARQTLQSSTSGQKRKRHLTTKADNEPTRAKESNASKQIKKKLNLSPERRAQLAAAMKARWATKRAAAEANPQGALISQDPACGQVDPAP